MCLFLLNTLLQTSADFLNVFYLLIFLYKNKACIESLTPYVSFYLESRFPLI